MPETPSDPLFEAALQPPHFHFNPGPEFADDVRQFQGIPGIERSAKGRLWAVWYSGGLDEGPENYLVLVTSNDAGQTWSNPAWVVDPIHPEVRAFDPCLWLDPQNRLWLFWSQSLGGWDGRFGVWAAVSENADSAMPNWSTQRRLSDGIMMNKPTAAANGDWHLPVSIWPRREPHRPPHYFDPAGRTGAWDLVSRDQGATFEFLGKADDQENRVFDEHQFIELRDGRWWMLSRTKAGIWENFSEDGGRHWLRGKASAIPHINSRFFIRRLTSGNLLLVRHNSFPTDGAEWPPRSHLTAFLSDDDGHSWQGGLLLDERVGVSYPDGVEMPDGTLHIIYDFNRTKDKHLLLATFTEDDIRAGAWVSPVARRAQLINQATAEGREGPAPRAVRPS